MLTKEKDGYLYTVNVNPYFLIKIGVILANREQATAGEIAKASEVLEALKDIPDREILLVKYFRNIRVYKRTEILHTGGVFSRYYGRALPRKELAKALNVSAKKLKGMEERAREALEKRLIQNVMNGGSVIAYKHKKRVDY